MTFPKWFSSSWTIVWTWWYVEPSSSWSSNSSQIYDFSSCSTLDVTCLVSELFSPFTDFFDVLGGSWDLIYSTWSFISTSNFGTWYWLFSETSTWHCEYLDFDFLATEYEDMLRLRSDYDLLDSILYIIQGPIIALYTPISQLAWITTSLVAPDDHDTVCMLWDLYTVNYQFVFAPNDHTPTVLIPQLEPYIVHKWDKTILDYLMIIIIWMISLALLAYYFNLSSS